MKNPFWVSFFFFAEFVSRAIRVFFFFLFYFNAKIKKINGILIIIIWKIVFPNDLLIFLNV